MTLHLEQDEGRVSERNPESTVVKSFGYAARAAITSRFPNILRAASIWPMCER